MAALQGIRSFTEFPAHVQQKMCQVAWYQRYTTIAMSSEYCYDDLISLRTINVDVALIKAIKSWINGVFPVKTEKRQLTDCVKLCQLHWLESA